MARILVACFSREGHVAIVAKEIARRLGADLDEITPETGYAGQEGYNRAGKEAFLCTKPAIRSRDPAGYDLVVVGSPVWVMNMASPVRSYLSQNREKIRNAAFFTAGGSPFKFALWRMERLYGKKPVAALCLQQHEIAQDIYKNRLEQFMKELKAWIERQSAP